MPALECSILESQSPASPDLRPGNVNLTTINVSPEVQRNLEDLLRAESVEQDYPIIILSRKVDSDVG